MAVSIRYYDIDKENVNKFNLSNGGGLRDLSNESNGTYLNFLLDNYDDPNYLTFDGNGIDLKEKNKKFYSSDDYAGCISASASDGLKQIGNCGLKIVSKSDIPLKPEKGITLTFYGNCCNKIYAMYRNENGESVFEEEINVGKEIFTLYPSVEFFALELYFIETVLPNQLIKISNVKIGEVVVLERFKSVGLTEETNVLSDDLPMNSLNFTIMTDDGNKLKSGNPVAIYNNQKNFGTFLISDVKRSSEYGYDITALNSIYKLEKTTLDKWQIDTDFKVALSWLCDISGVTFENKLDGTAVEILSGGTYPFDIDKLFLKGYIGVGSCRKALCAMGFALGFIVDASRGNKIILKSVPTKVTSVITTADRRIIGNAVLTEKDTVKTAKTHTITAFLEKVAEEVNYDNGGKYYVGSLPMVRKPTVVSGNIENLEWSACYLKFSSEGAVTLKVYPAELCKIVSHLTNPNATDVETNETDFTKFDLSGYYTLSDGSEGSPYVTDAVTREKDFLKYIQSRGTVSAKIRLQNERVGDLIQIETAWDGIITGIITKMNISLGYEEIADIEVLEWQIG